MKSGDQINIDELFKTGLDPDFDPVTYEEEYWLKLDKRLTWFEKKRKALALLRPLSGIAALLLLGFFIYTLWHSSEDSSIQRSLTEQHKQSTPAEISAETDAPRVDPEEPKPNPTSNAIASASSTKSSATQKQTKTESSPPESSTAYPTNETEINMPNTTNKKEPEPVATATNKEELSSKQEKPIDSSKQPEAELQPDEPLIAGFDPDIEQAKSKGNPITLSLLVAPAYNGVETFNNGSVGSDFGLVVSIGLSKKWSVSTGALYAKKVYETDVSTYGYGNGYTNQLVDADCRVLDVPINVNYALINRGKTTLSVGTGLSSYFMLKEDYYYYSNSSGYGSAPDDIHLTNENHHWLSVLNFQANIQQQLSSKISISLQPYLKLPFEDIGYAKVRLQSVGMALSANWNI